MTKVNRTDIKVGINTFKSLREGRVLIESGSQDEINVLSTTITTNCGTEVEVNTEAKESTDSSS